jgi:hypothetical protein
VLHVVRVQVPVQRGEVLGAVKSLELNAVVRNSRMAALFRSV